MIRRAVAAISLAALLGIYYAALTHAQAPSPDAVAQAITRALVVWERPDGSPVFVAHCRRAHGGCAARARRVAALVVRAAWAHDLDAWLLAALVMRESGANPDAIGAIGETGLVQLHPRSRAGIEAERRCTERPRECSAIVVDVGARVLAGAIATCGSELEGLGRYHSGRCRVDDYARSVLARRAALRGASWRGK